MTTEIHTFKAWVRGATVDSKGELTISVVVPKEHKYEALPITDHGAIMQEFSVKIVKEYSEDEMDDLLDGFVLPEGAGFGDGNGELSNRGGVYESPNVNEGKIVVPSGGVKGRKKQV